jgi:hypothetical protein
MANLSNFAVTIQLSGSVANPNNSVTFQCIAPWGQTVPCYNLQEALNDIFFGKGGSQWSGKMGQYFAAQTLNGATGTGPTGFTSANAIESTP